MTEADAVGSYGWASREAGTARLDLNEAPREAGYVRVTVGSRGDGDALIAALRAAAEER